MVLDCEVKFSLMIAVPSQKRRLRKLSNCFSLDVGNMK